MNFPVVNEDTNKNVHLIEFEVRYEYTKTFYVMLTLPAISISVMKTMTD